MLSTEIEALGKGGDLAWLDMVQRESAFVIALARLEAEDRKEKRDQAQQETKA